MAYSIIGGDANNLFTIDSRTGRIKIQKDPNISLSSVQNNSVVLTVQVSFECRLNFIYIGGFFQALLFIFAYSIYKYFYIILVSY